MSQNNIDHFARPKTIADLCACGQPVGRDSKEKKDGTECGYCYWVHPKLPPLSDKARQRIVDRVKDLPRMG